MLLKNIKVCQKLNKGCSKLGDWRNRRLCSRDCKFQNKDQGYWEQGGFPDHDLLYDDDEDDEEDHCQQLEGV